MINFNGCDRREFHIVQPERALDQGIAWNPHYLDRDQSRLPSRREVSQQFPPATLTGSDERGTVRLWS